MPTVHQLFIAGRMTFQDGGHGTPRYEGRCEDGRLVKSEQCQSEIELAVKAAEKARKHVV